MDHNLIYAKTAAGERTVLERTRIMPRNVRMVLILVDSQSSVGDLCLKTGNPQLTESALRELEQGGFIEQRVEQDSLWGESRRVAQEIRAAADKQKEADLAAQSEVSAAPSQAAPSPLPLARRIKGLFSRPSATAAGKDNGVPQESAVTGLDRRAVGEAEPSLQAAPTVGAGKPEPRPARRRRRPLSWPLRIAVSLVAVLAALSLTLLAFPYASYLPELEAAMTNACGRQVKVSQLRLDLYPRMTLRLGDVRLGVAPDAIHIAEISLRPEVGALISGKWTPRALAISGVALSGPTLAALPAIFAELSRHGTTATIGRVALEKAELTIGGFALAPMSGEATLSADRRLESLAVHSADRRLTVSATPQHNGYSVVVEGIDWRPSAESPLLFDSINISGVYQEEVFAIEAMALRLFDGIVEGVATVRSPPQSAVAGELTFQRINIGRLESALGLGQPLDGEGAGRIRFSSRGAAWADFVSAIDAEGEFSVQRGSLRGVDLGEAARSVSPMPTQGGETRFENLSGRLRLAPDNYLFSDVVINSGLMQATGYFALSDGRQLSGSLELHMRGTVNQTRVPMRLGGTLASPTVQAGRRP